MLGRVEPLNAHVRPLDPRDDGAPQVRQRVGTNVRGTLLTHPHRSGGEPGGTLGHVVVRPDELALALRFARRAGADALGVDGREDAVVVVTEHGIRRIIDAVEASFDHVVARSVEKTWSQVFAYSASPDEQLRDDLTKHVDAVFRAVLITMSEGRPARPSDFPITAAQAAHRVRQGVSLSDFLQAYRIAQVTLWEGVLDAAGNDPETRDAALSLAAHVMHVIEVGSSVAAEAYLAAQQHQLAESDRVRRDLLEDLLARRDLPPGPKQAMLPWFGRPKSSP